MHQNLDLNPAYRLVSGTGVDFRPGYICSAESFPDPRALLPSELNHSLTGGTDDTLMRTLRQASAAQVPREAAAAAGGRQTDDRGVVDARRGAGGVFDYFFLIVPWVCFCMKTTFQLPSVK